ncbi:hypothetical protein RCC89_05470 [Cytophagaceae bacterium ABcell3]|nr:hypothetical protein RCC89_05470 [Cytophagaceae bacterium ABcell3]
MTKFNDKKTNIIAHFWVGGILPVLLYFLFYIFYTYPLLFQFNGHVPGSGGDVYQYLWNAWVSEASPSNMFSLKTDYLFAPKGISLMLHTSTPIMSFFSQMFSNNILGINIFLALNFVLSGLGAFLLSRLYISSIAWCLLVGFIFAFAPWKMMRLTEHYNLVLTAPLVFYIYFFTKTFDFGNPVKVTSTTNLLFCFVAGLLTLASDLVLTMLAFYFSVAWFVAYRFRNISWSFKSVGFFIVLWVVAHFIIRLLRLSFDDVGAFWWGSDLLNLFVPPAHHFFSNLFSESFISSLLPQEIENVNYLGIVLIVLAVISWVLKKKLILPSDIKVFALLALIFAFLTMPVFKIAGVTLFNNPLSFIHFVPGINNFRIPGRFVLLVYLCLPIAVFYILDKKGVKPILGVPLFLLFLIDYYPRQFPSVQLNESPKIYNNLKQLHGEVLLPVPFGIRDGFNEAGKFNVKDLWYQSLHHKNIIGGYVSRVPEEVWAFYHQNPVMDFLLKVQENPSLKVPDFSENEVEDFFLVYKPDIVLIAPQYRNTSVEQFIDQLVMGRAMHQLEKDGYKAISISWQSKLY